MATTLKTCKIHAITIADFLFLFCILIPFKNSSLIYSKDLSAIRLVPFYDVICTKVYESSTDEMSVSINGRQNVNQITREDLEQEAKNCGLGSKAAMKIYDEVLNGIQKALLDSADELSRAGFTEAQPMAEKILGYVKK